MKKKETDILCNNFLFQNINKAELTEVLSSLKYEIRSFGKGECIYSPTHYEKKIGIIMSGVCEVRRIHTDGGFVPLNRIAKCGSFGICAIFSEKEIYPTHVYAITDSTVLFFTQNEILRLVSSSPTVAVNILRFMAGRIDFLNDKISTFSSNNVEQKLASHIIQLYNQCGSTTLAFNKKRGAEAINAGRASLYRAIDKLQAMGLIIMDNKNIIINDLTGLERISK